MKRTALLVSLLSSLWAGSACAQSTVKVIGPVTPGNCASFNSTTIIKDAGAACGGGSGTVANPTAAVGLTAVNGAAVSAIRSDGAPPLSAAVQSALTGTNGQILTGTGSFGYSSFALAGDCTFLSPNITCTKTNGSSFAPSATTDTTNASNISSGTLGLAEGGLHASQVGATANQIPVYPGGGGGAAPTSLTTLFDAVCSSTVGQIWVRMTGAWGCSLLGYINPDWYGATPSPLGTAAGSVVDNSTQINAALAAAASDKTKLRFGRGVYGIGNGMSSGNDVIIEGMGVHATTLLLQPSAPTAAVTFQNGGGIVNDCGIRDLSINSADTATLKVGISMIDAHQCTVSNVMISAYPTGQWTAAAGVAVGLQTQGRDLSVIDNVQIYADTPIELSENPHAVGVGEDMDSWTFNNLTLVSQLTGATKDIILVDSGVSIFNTHFVGHQSWSGGVDGFHWIDAGAVASFGLEISGVKDEQAGDGGGGGLGAGWTINISPNNIYGLNIKNSIAGTRGGIKLRNVTGAALVSGYVFTAVGNNKAGLDINSSVKSLNMTGNAFLTNTTATIAGQSTLYADPIPTGFAAIPPTVTYTAGTAGVAFQASPPNPAATASVASVMMGLGSTCAITPVRSTRVRLSIKGNMSNNTNGQANIAFMQYGTGVAPANGVAPPGGSVPLGTSSVGHSAATGLTLPFTAGGVATGLTIGTPYWFDIADAVTGGTGTLSSLSCDAFEIP